MKKLFYTAKEFLALQEKLTAAEAQLSGVKAHFGEAANADGFDVVAAVSSLGDPGDEQEEKPDENAEKVAELERKVQAQAQRIAELEKLPGASAAGVKVNADGTQGGGTTAQAADDIIKGARSLYSFVAGN